MVGLRVFSRGEGGEIRIVWPDKAREGFPEGESREEVVDLAADVEVGVELMPEGDVSGGAGLMGEVVDRGIA